MKRLLLILVLAIGAAAQEPAAEKTESKEPGIAWRWANFAILAGALAYGANKMLPPFFRSRTEEIQKGISEAQQIKRDAEKRAAEMDARLAALGADIEKFRTQAHSDMEAEGVRIRQEAAKQIEHHQQQAEQEIESSGKTARRELKKYAAELALDLAEQRIRTRLDGATEAAMVDGFMKDLQNQGSKN